MNIKDIFKLFLLLMILNPIFLFSQILSFESFASADFISMHSPFYNPKNAFSLGIESRFSDYSYVDADNEFHLSVLISFQSKDGWRIATRLPYQWSWNVSLQRVMEEPSVIHEDGIEDWRIETGYTFIMTRSYAMMGEIYFTRTAQPDFWNEQPEKRYDYSFSFTTSYKTSLIELAFSVLGTFHSSGINTGSAKIELPLYTSLGAAGVLFPEKKLNLIGEILYQQSQPKYLSSLTKVETQNWYSFKGGWRFSLTDRFILKGSLTVSFRNGFILFADESEEDTFDLARETLQLFYVFR